MIKITKDAKDVIHPTSKIVDFLAQVYKFIVKYYIFLMTVKYKKGGYLTTELAQW